MKKDALKTQIFKFAWNILRRRQVSHIASSLDTACDNVVGLEIYVTIKGILQVKISAWNVKENQIVITLGYQISNFSSFHSKVDCVM